jgi:hypothetical protein
MANDLDIDALNEWRRDRDDFCRNHYASPIPEDHLPAFDGLKYFDRDPAFILTGDFSAAEGKSKSLRQPEAHRTTRSPDTSSCSSVLTRAGWWCSLPKRMSFSHPFGTRLVPPDRTAAAGTPRLWSKKKGKQRLISTGR